MDIVPNLGVASQHKDYMLDKVAMDGWNVALAQPVSLGYFE